MKGQALNNSGAFNDLNVTFSDAIDLSALNVWFPDNILQPDRVDVGVDTADLAEPSEPNSRSRCTTPSLPIVRLSVGVDTSDLSDFVTTGSISGVDQSKSQDREEELRLVLEDDSNETQRAEPKSPRDQESIIDRQPVSIMTPPITPLDDGKSENRESTTADFGTPKTDRNGDVHASANPLSMSFVGAEVVIGEPLLNSTVACNVSADSQPESGQSTVNHISIHNSPINRPSSINQVSTTKRSPKRYSPIIHFSANRSPANRSMKPPPSFATPQVRRPLFRQSGFKTPQPRPVKYSTRSQEKKLFETEPLTRKSIWTRGPVDKSDGDGTKNTTNESTRTTSPPTERVLRPRPAPPSRYMGDSWGAIDSNDESCIGYFEMPPRTRANAHASANPDTDGKTLVMEKRIKIEKPNSSCEDQSSSLPTPKRKKVVETDQSTTKPTSSKKRKQDKPITHECKPCNRVFTSQGGYNVHMNCQHLGVRYRCALCQLVLSMVPNMGNHFRREHPNRVHELSQLIIKFVDEDEITR